MACITQTNWVNTAVNSQRDEIIAIFYVVICHSHSIPHTLIELVPGYLTTSGGGGFAVPIQQNLVKH